MTSLYEYSISMNVANLHSAIIEETDVDMEVKGVDIITGANMDI